MYLIALSIHFRNGDLIQLIAATLFGDFKSDGGVNGFGHRYALEDTTFGSQTSVNCRQRLRGNESLTRLRARVNVRLLTNRLLSFGLTDQQEYRRPIDESRLRKLSSDDVDAKVK